MVSHCLTPFLRLSLPQLFCSPGLFPARKEAQKLRVPPALQPLKCVGRAQGPRGGPAPSSPVLPPLPTATLSCWWPLFPCGGHLPGLHSQALTSAPFYLSTCDLWGLQAASLQPAGSVSMMPGNSSFPSRPAWCSADSPSPAHTGTDCQMLRPGGLLPPWLSSLPPAKSWEFILAEVRGQEKGERFTHFQFSPPSSFFSKCFLFFPL